MPNTTNKDYTKYSQRQLFNLMKKEQEIEKLKRDRAYLEKKMAKELEKKDKGFHNKLEELNKILQEINRRANDCCFGHEIPNIETQQAMRDVLNGENLETIEDFSAWANEIKKEVNAEN
ncbi:hypothetical protein [Helicobacter pylori]|uniref:hypothetical protein n=1 Tax=Helicobacter pylori TaxID=210 RepID=UPI00025ACA62|nr:hypothetical protein [Helicobacter pylori]EIE28022.1 Hypothetical protein HP17_05305 [Helicobacter pylori NCTC 11637 = CCUG 17874 = ATCC 43504 = JCM 12093]MBM0602443.1 hypothetical protein [Helicobacter pylori]MBM0609758.1 hypothetical protein [Helicobacter pylori]MBM0618873.1 hypothetical protein [Helicobacter pylori]MBM0626221.1 hypothetical protein [Helicobacter pylori]